MADSQELSNLEKRAHVDLFLGLKPGELLLLLQNTLVHLGAKRAIFGEQVSR
jgi:hypothetical protein